MNHPASILLVDDNRANLLALEAILEPLGQRTLTADSGEEALKRLMQHDDVAVILMDVRMPGIDGFETARLIKQRERSRHIPIVFLTGLGEDEAQLFRGYEQGAVDYIRKPIDGEILCSKVRVFVELHQRGAELQRQAALLREHELAALERRSEERYRSFIDAMPQCVWASGPDGEIQYANEVWRRFAGVGRGETDGALLNRLIHPEDQPLVHAAWKRALATGEPYEVQFRLRRADGAWRWHLGRGVPERDEAGKVIGWIATATDIDDQKATEAALQETEHALRQANEAKDVFIAAASHELRTPLTVVSAQTGLALRRLGPEDDSRAARSLRTIARQVDRMVRLVEDLLDVGRLQSGRLSLELEEFDLAQLLGEARERMQLLSDAHPIEFHASGEAAIHGDRHRIDQVITNLLSNAVRYSPEGGAIVLSLEEREDSLHITVRDHGVGIPLERQAEIFERFGQAHGVRYGGLGLGLTISQGIVAQHGGRIWVESDGVEGQGSTFHVELPRWQGEQLQASGAH